MTIFRLSPASAGAIRVLVIIAAIVFWGIAPTRADEAANRLERLEQALDEERGRKKALAHKAAVLASEVASLRRKLIPVAARARAFEAKAAALEANLTDLEQRAAAQSAALGHRRIQLVGVIRALQRIALHPPEALAALPANPSDTVRSSLLLRSAVPEIEKLAASLGKQIASLHMLRLEMKRERRSLSETEGRLVKERTHLQSLVRLKMGLAVKTDSESRMVAKSMTRIAASASDLRELLQKLETMRRKPRPSRANIKRPVRLPLSARRDATPLASANRPNPFSARFGKLPLPAIGLVVGRFDQTDKYGRKRQGVTIETRASAQVVVPHDGSVVFAGPFRGYGQLLIIEHGEGYHSLLAGMARIDTAVGDRVIAGEPVGAMAGQKRGDRRLYLELRRKGQPINPLPWLAASRNRISG